MVRGVRGEQPGVPLPGGDEGGRGEPLLQAREPLKRRVAVAARRLGYPSLRPGQEEAVSALLERHDVLVVMPTGSGKSAIYQVAALLVDGPTVVVSPLIALQRDQVEAIEETGAAPAAPLNSTLTQAQREETLEALEDGAIEFLFLAPEQLGNDETRARVGEAGPALFVVDEAHCISEWGHDFRPDYLRLGAAIDELGHPRVLALTATASPRIREEIVDRLGMRDTVTVVRGFDRPNIRLAVETFHDDRAKTDALVERVLSAPKPGIVYTATRARAEELAAELGAGGVRAAAYHAGLAAGERERVQTAFMEDDLDVVVATIAFGMGIDKANVRFVYHSEISDSVDAYYQEIGRAGRDGVRADAVLFYRPEDVGLRRFFGGAAALALDDVEAVVEAVADADGAVDAEEVAAETGLSTGKVETAIARLRQGGGAEAAVEAQEAHREFERSRVEMMRAYAELRDCRREFLLNYFGEPRDEPCGFCDNCEAGVVAPGGRRPFGLGSRVRHGLFGNGSVQRYESDKMVVLFDRVGYKTLDVDLVAAEGLLESA